VLGRLSRLTARLANIRAVLILFILMLPLNLLIFPARTARLKELSGIADPILDAKYWYAPDTAYKLIGSLTEDGRRIYAITQVTVDLVYPILLNLFMTALMAFLFARAFRPGSPMQRLPLLPYATLLADWGENVCLIVLILAYPTELTALARLASLFTTIKWVSGITSGVLILVGVLGWLIKRIRNE
jgi:hypothetical protein